MNISIEYILEQLAFEFALWVLLFGFILQLLVERKVIKNAAEFEAQERLQHWRANAIERSRSRKTLTNETPRGLTTPAILTIPLDEAPEPNAEGEEYSSDLEEEPTGSDMNIHSKGEDEDGGETDEPHTPGTMNSVTTVDSVNSTRKPTIALLSSGTATVGRHQRRARKSSDPGVRFMDDTTEPSLTVTISKSCNTNGAQVLSIPPAASPSNNHNNNNNNNTLSIASASSPSRRESFTRNLAPLHKSAPSTVSPASSQPNSARMGSSTPNPLFGERANRSISLPPSPHPLSSSKLELSPGGGHMAAPTVQHIRRPTPPKHGPQRPPSMQILTLASKPAKPDILHVGKLQFHFHRLGVAICLLMLIRYFDPYGLHGIFSVQTLSFLRNYASCGLYIAGLMAFLYPVFLVQQVVIQTSTNPVKLLAIGLGTLSVVASTLFPALYSVLGPLQALDAAYSAVMIVSILTVFILFNIYMKTLRDSANFAGRQPFRQLTLKITTPRESLNITVPNANTSPNNTNNNNESNNNNNTERTINIGAFPSSPVASAAPTHSSTNSLSITAGHSLALPSPSALSLLSHSPSHLDSLPSPTVHGSDSSPPVSSSPQKGESKDCSSATWHPSRGSGNNNGISAFNLPPSSESRTAFNYGTAPRLSLQSNSPFKDTASTASGRNSNVSTICELPIPQSPLGGASSATQLKRIRALKRLTVFQFIGNFTVCVCCLVAALVTIFEFADSSAHWTVPSGSVFSNQAVAQLCIAIIQTCGLGIMLWYSYMPIKVLWEDSPHAVFAKQGSRTSLGNLPSMRHFSRSRSRTDLVDKRPIVQMHAVSYFTPQEQQQQQLASNSNLTISSNSASAAVNLETVTIIPSLI